jgi:large subunit ribosomal protein L17
MLFGNLAAVLIRHGRIEARLAKAKALRPFIEKIVTLAKRESREEAVEGKFHFRRLARGRVRSVEAVRILFDEKASEFLRRDGGYPHIYKFIPRLGDAREMAIVEIVFADDVG